MNDKYDDLILTIDTHEEVNSDKSVKRTNVIEQWAGPKGIIIEHRELEVGDYELVGEFRGRSISIIVEYKAWDNFLSDDIDDMKKKLARSRELYDHVVFFLECGNYTYSMKDDDLILNPTNPNLDLRSKTLAMMEGFLDTIGANGVHVRQLRSVYHFPDALNNLLIYSIREHDMKINGDVYKQMLMKMDNIGPKAIEKILKSFPDLYTLSIASENKLCEAIGNKRGKTLYEFIHQKSHQCFKCGLPAKNMTYQKEKILYRCDNCYKNYIESGELQSSGAGASPPGTPDMPQSSDTKAQTGIPDNSGGSLPLAPGVLKSSKDDRQDSVLQSPTNPSTSPVDSSDAAGAPLPADSQLTDDRGGVVPPSPPDLSSIRDIKHAETKLSQKASSFDKDTAEDLRRMKNTDEYKMSLIEGLKKFFSDGKPHTMQEVVDNHSNWDKGRVFDFVMGGVKSGYLRSYINGKQGKVFEIDGWKDLGNVELKPRIDIGERIKKYTETCIELNFPMFAPKNGICYNCKKQIFEELDGSKPIKGCPYCHRSYCD